MRDHLLAAAERGVFVRVLVDDSFVLDADADLLAIDAHPGIELKVFNPYRRRSSHAAEVSIPRAVSSKKAGKAS